MSDLKRTKRALINSMISVVLCVTMLFGATFAWFTDTVSVKNNKIQAGMLAVDLYAYDTDTNDYVLISDSEEPLFAYDKWEPGYSSAHLLKIKNNGNLALSWSLTVTEIATKSNATAKLANAIDVYTLVGATELPTDFETVKSTYEKRGTLADFLASSKGAAEGVALPADDGSGEETVAIVLHMQETAGNAYQGLSVGGGLDIRLVATQYATESDAFGNDYDEAAKDANKLILTQKERVGRINVRNQSKVNNDVNTYYKEFFEVATEFAQTPGLNENIAPQGIDVCDATGYVYISGYFKTADLNPYVEDGTNPTTITVLDKTGKFVAEYVMWNEDGTPLTSHMGGVAVSDDTLFFSYNQETKADGGKAYRVATIPLADLSTSGHCDVVVPADRIYYLPIQPSYLNYSDGVLWVGNFYNANSSYPAPDGLGTQVVNGTTYGSYLLGYEIQSGSDLTKKYGSHAFAMPDSMYLLYDKQYQGGAVLSDGTLVLSRSYGRNNDSYVRIFDLNSTTADTTTVTLDGQEYNNVKAFSSALKSIKNIPLSEGACLNPSSETGRDVLVLYEAGSYLYDDGKVGSDYIWSFAIPTLAEMYGN